MKKTAIEIDPVNVMILLSIRYKELRRQKKMSQVQVAKKAGISLRSVRIFEQYGKISLLSLLKLAQLHGRVGDFIHIFGQKDEQE